MQGRRGLILFELRPSSSTPSMASVALTLPVASLRLCAVVGGGTDGRIPRLPPQEAGRIGGGWPALRSCSSSSAMACPGPRARRSLVAWSPPAAVSSNRVLNQDGMAPRRPVVALHGCTTTAMAASSWFSPGSKIRCPGSLVANGGADSVFSFCE